DSLRVRYGIWNRGIDTARSELYLTLSITDNGIQPILIHDNEAFGITESPLEAGRGYIMRETLIGYDEMDAAGLVFPFEVCVDLTYDGTDPDLNNNHYCVTVDLPSGINNYSTSNMNVYPNPANNVIYVNNAEGAQVTVFDINGKVVAEVEAATATQSIDVANLTQGLYIVRIANGNEVATSKISIVR
ncbi:MAG TPA: T9SS type A sorting domain-containing protein, partial [Bacteroidales bacterium]|nr:T9SS type A sorting domain-containing protein [Bacteroidales bacterium]